LARLKYLAPRKSVSGAKERKGGGRGGRGVSESYEEKGVCLKIKANRSIVTALKRRLAS
jgi:hypothetical protein